MKKLCYLIFSILLLTGCEPRVTFEDPQPIDVKGLSKVSKNLIGNYFCKAGSTFLTIDKDLIFKQEFFIDSIINDTTSIFKIIIPEFYYGTQKVKSYEDTIFNFKYGDIFKKFKGIYFLNHQYEKGKWGVKKITINKNYLKLGQIGSKEELKTIRNITDVREDSITTFKLTKKQFKEFLKNKNFRQENEYIKIK
jgi:hypothetical protein